MLAQAYTLFGGIALFVAAIGLFGLMSYNVSRRTREIGIRMAMGAQRKEVLGLVLRESMLLVIAGIAIGIAAALGAGRFVASQLFGLEPTDPTTMMAAIVVMLAVSAAAGYLPARRAARVDPMVALQIRIGLGIVRLVDRRLRRLYHSRHAHHACRRRRFGVSGCSRQTEPAAQHRRSAKTSRRSFTSIASAVIGPVKSAPMSLLTYEQARPYAKAIANAVTNRTMPPWHADAPAGTFHNERSLSDAERQTLTAWAAGGAVNGEPERLAGAADVQRRMGARQT